MSCAPLDDELLDELDELEELLEELELDELELLLEELELLLDELEDELTLPPPQPFNKAAASVTANGVATIPNAGWVFI